MGMLHDPLCRNASWTLGRKIQGIVGGGIHGHFHQTARGIINHDFSHFVSIGAQVIDRHSSAKSCYPIYVGPTIRTTLLLCLALMNEIMPPMFC